LRELQVVEITTPNRTVSESFCVCLCVRSTTNENKSVFIWCRPSYLSLVSDVRLCLHHLQEQQLIL
jgi:hypothetical protein